MTIAVFDFQDCSKQVSILSKSFSEDSLYQIITWYYQFINFYKWIFHRKCQICTQKWEIFTFKNFTYLVFTIFRYIFEMFYKTYTNKSWLTGNIKYRIRAINNRSLNSGKTFWAEVCGYYSREVTIQEKLFCTGYFLQLYFTKLVVKFFRKF